MRNSSTRFVFTKAALEALDGTGEAYQVYDEQCRGLVLLIYPSGSKTFFRQGRVDGKVRRIRIGKFPGIGVHAARKKCAEMNGKITEGKPPMVATRGGPTFADLWDQYWTEHATIKKAESSQKYDLWQWERILKPAWEHTKVAHIRKSTVLALLTDVARHRGKPSSNRLLALVHKVFEHAVERERLEVNPASRIERYPEHSRDRFLQPDEMVRFFQALDDFDNPDAADFWRVSLFTGARQGNVLAMRWEDVDFSSRVWTIPKTKAQKPQRVPLVDPVVEILNRRRNLSKHVFPGRTGDEHMTKPRQPWERLLKQAGIENLTMHDLRRSLGSWQAAAGVSELLIGKTLGHSPGSKATSVYARLNLDPVRAAMATAVDAMVSAAASDAGQKEGTTHE